MDTGYTVQFKHKRGISALCTVHPSSYAGQYEAAVGDAGRTQWNIGECDTRGFRTDAKDGYEVSVNGEDFYVRKGGEGVSVNNSGWSVHRVLTVPVLEHESLIETKYMRLRGSDVDTLYSVIEKMWNVCYDNKAPADEAALRRAIGEFDDPTMLDQMIVTYTLIQKSIPEYEAAKAQVAREAYVKRDDTWTVYPKQDLPRTVLDVFIKDGDDEMKSPRIEFRRASHPSDKMRKLPDHVKCVMVHTGPSGMVRSVAALGFMNVQRFHLDDGENAHYINIDFMACVENESTIESCTAMIDEIAKLGRSFGCKSIYTAPPLRFKAKDTDHGETCTFVLSGGPFTFCRLGFRFCAEMPILDMKTCSVGMARNI